MKRVYDKDPMGSSLSAGITRREAIRKVGKYGIYVPATMAVLTAAPRAFAQSPQPVPDAIFGTVSWATGGMSPYIRARVYLRQGAVYLNSACITSGASYNFSLAGVNLNQAWMIDMSLSTVDTCATGTSSGFSLAASGPDAGVGSDVGGLDWQVAGGAWASGATTGEVNFTITST